MPKSKTYRNYFIRKSTALVAMDYNQRRGLEPLLSRRFGIWRVSITIYPEVM